MVTEKVTGKRSPHLDSRIERTQSDPSFSVSQGLSCPVNPAAQSQRDPAEDSCAGRLPPRHMPGSAREGCSVSDNAQSALDRVPGQCSS